MGVISKKRKEMTSDKRLGLVDASFGSERRVEPSDFDERSKKRHYI
jgi:hypothetical protein